MAEKKAEGGQPAQRRGKDGKSRQGGGLSQIMSFAGGHRYFTYLGIALSAVSMLLGFVPYACIWLVVRDLIAVAPDWSSATSLSTYGWVAFVAAAVGILVYFGALMCTHLAAFRTANNMRKTCAEHLMRVPLGYFDTHASGEIRRIIDGSVGLTESLLAHQLPDAGGTVAMVVGMLVMLFVFDWRMGLACLLAAVISVGCLMSMMGGKGVDYMNKYQVALDRMNKAGTEYVRGIPVVKVFQQTVYSFKAFHDAIEDYGNMAHEYSVTLCRVPQSLNLTFVDGVVVLLVPAVLLIAPGVTDWAKFLTDYAFYAVFSAIISTALQRMMFAAAYTQQADNAMRRISGVLDAPTLAEPADPRHPKDASIAFDDVSFSYEGAASPALDHVSLEVPSGSTVALVGPSGGGKTTAASLVPRFWDVGSGAVRVGGVDVRQVAQRDLMDQVAFVFQNDRLFKGTILDNVRAARPDATREQALAALEAAQCSDIVDKMPHGVDEFIGTGGTYLSGGEVQRIALARAILKDSPIVVLDEATAFADPENEALIQLALARLAKGRTVLMVAHRLSTVRGADQIVVLDAGHVAERGTHEQLVAEGGLYARMWADYQTAVDWKISGTRGGSSGAAPSVGGAVADAGATATGREA